MSEVKPAHEHEQRRTISIDIFIPDHPDRSDSPIFRATRKKLIEDNSDACCIVCSTREQLELHHSVVEWCDSDGVDWKRVAKLVPSFDWASFDATRPETFIDSEFNANMVLCKEHHTGKDHGIHMMDFPTWNYQRTKRSDEIFSPDEEAT